MELFHDSRDTEYRYPFGARPAGAKVRLRLAADDGFTRACVRTWHDGREILTEMKRTDERFEVEITLPDSAGLYWYYFIAYTADGRQVLYGNAPDCMGGIGAAYDHEPPSFQITLYDPGYETPEWMRQSALYQIFPDRFASSGEYDYGSLRPDMRYHTNWGDAPDMRIVGTDNAADDIFGGDLRGITQNLDYIASLGIGVLYLNPIFRAASNHKYDTGCYMEIDPAFGTEDDLRELCSKAREKGIRVILDGVFSHTGADSLYFDRYGRYGGHGAYCDMSSPYSSWYRFRAWPDDYECWWDFKTLPNVNENDPSFREYILGGGDSVIAHWPGVGTSGWRLDVADELPMDFLRALRQRLKQSRADACVIGEVWENASRKVTYGELRNYCAGDTLDSCMNYPLRDALISFMLFKSDAFALERMLESQREDYAYPFLYSCMNLLGSHDKPRAISVLSGRNDLEPPRAERHAYEPTTEEYTAGKRRYLAALEFITALPGMPSVYYGDEAGATGMADPFCRGTYPRGREDMELINRVSAILRGRADVMKTGLCRVKALSRDVICVCRYLENGKDAFGSSVSGPAQAVCVLNRSRTEAVVSLCETAGRDMPSVTVPAEGAVTVFPEQA